LHFISLHFDGGKPSAQIIILAGWSLKHPIGGLQLGLFFLKTFELVEKLLFVAFTLLENIFLYL
jgi:hypothetical protein